MAGPYGKVLEAFQQWDSNGDGFIDVDELRVILIKLNIDEHVIPAMFADCDLGSDGKLSYSDFLRWIFCEAKTRIQEHAGVTADFIVAGDEPQVDKVYYIVNAAHQKLLDTHGGPVWVHNGDGKLAGDVISQNTSRHRNNLCWKVLYCPHQSDVVYLFNLGQFAFLDTNGRKVQVWNKRGIDRDEVIEHNTSKWAGNLRWRLVPCPHQKGAFYIVNSLHSAFLDTHGNEVSIWNNDGKDVEEIIEQNVTEHAGNIRWVLVDVQKQADIDAVNRASEIPNVGKSYYLVNVAHQRFLDAHGEKVFAWNNDGKPPLHKIARNRSRYANNIRWEVIQCPHDRDAVYLYNLGHHAFLNTNGKKIQLWNNNGKEKDEVIQFNTSKYAGNLRWKLVPCPHQKSACYVVNAAHGTFLDTYGSRVSVWNRGGTDVNTIIEDNTSKHAGNIRWLCIDVHKQNRFGSAMDTGGMRSLCSEQWVHICSAPPTPLRPGFLSLIRSQCEPDNRDEYAPIIRAYTLESELYTEANMALLEDDLNGAADITTYVAALRRAMHERCERGENLEDACVWRGMSIEEEFIKAYEKGKVFLWPNFVSTGPTEQDAFSGNVLFQIQLCRGMTSALNITAENQCGEREVLIMPYTGFRVKERVPDYTDCNGDFRTLIKLETCDIRLVDKDFPTDLPMATWDELKRAVGL